MPLFQALLVLLFLTVLLLQVSRKLGTPYPALLALAGIAVGALPWAPHLEFEPQLALALFVAPVLLDAAYDTSPRDLRQNWAPLISLVVVAVVLTTVAVALAGRIWGGLTWAAAIALGAIVAPPDAAAASAVLRQFRLPRRTMTILQGESLLNDAVALLIFGAAVATAVPGNPSFATSPLLLLAAAPGGAAMGWLAGRLYVPLAKVVAGTLGSSILQFTATFGVWVIAEHLHLSPILAVVAYGMTLARRIPSRISARERVHSYSIWAAVVFLLNVLAFLLMGMQARGVVSRLNHGNLLQSLGFASVVLALVILVRFGWIMTYTALVRWLRPKAIAVPEVRLGVLGSWCGMRGIITLATAFALPRNFPGRDVVVLSAFVVVIGTLVIQGLTLKSVIAFLRIEPDESLQEEVSQARTAMIDAALRMLDQRSGEEVAPVRAEFASARLTAQDRLNPQGATKHDRLHAEAIAQQRKTLESLRTSGEISDDAYHRLEEELDWSELAVTPNDELELRDG